jgi:hypothetical protein
VPPPPPGGGNGAPPPEEDPCDELEQNLKDALDYHQQVNDLRAEIVAEGFATVGTAPAFSSYTSDTPEYKEILTQLGEESAEAMHDAAIAQYALNAEDCP